VLFYLLQNPQSATVDATIRFLRPFGPPIERTYRLPPGSRTTIQVDGVAPELAATDVSGVVTSSLPIIVERAMYLDRPGQRFAAGHESAGVVAPATQWFLAEGNTGPFFDLFILLANPNPNEAAIRLDYMQPDGLTLSKVYSVPPDGRATIWVDDEEFPAGSGNKALANAAVSTTVTATNGVPIIVERTMWWPQPVWQEAHNSPATTVTGTLWALAEGEVGGLRASETYILIANTSATPGEAVVTLCFEDGTNVSRSYALAPHSRTSVPVSFPVTGGGFGSPVENRRFGALIKSRGPAPAQIVVERAMYTSPGGAVWAAGTNAVATRLEP